MLHPGSGTLAAIHGAERAAAVPGITALRLRCRPGDVLAPRWSTGQDVGQIHARGPERAAVVAVLEAAQAALRLEIHPI